MHAILSLPDGSRRRIGAAALLIGRAPSCDVVLSEPRISSRQALLRVASGRLQLYALGRNPTRLNDRPVDFALLKSGDRIGLPGGVELRVEQARTPGLGPDRAVLVDGVAFAVHAEGLCIGGGAEDDVQLDGWPPAACTLHAPADVLLIEAGESGIALQGRQLEPEVLTEVVHGDVIAWGEKTVEASVVWGVEVSQTAETGRRLRAVSFRFLPAGGALTLDYGHESVTCTLSELRCRLIATLLQPPSGMGRDEFVSDEWVLSRVWPGQTARSHHDLNTLVHRLRKDLLKHGVDPTRLIERARQGGGTRLLLSPRVKISVQ